MRSAGYTILVAFTFCSFVGKSQSNFSLKYFGLTIHPFGDYSASIQPHKLDKQAYLVVNFGGYASYEYYVWLDKLSVRVKQGVFTDCAGGPMGVSHLGVQMNLFEIKRHRLGFAIGPTLIYRKDWNRFDIYKDSGFWKRYHSSLCGDIQYKIILYGCEFEYDWLITDKFNFSAGFTPGFPFAFTFSAGIKYWFSRDFKKNYMVVAPGNK